MHVVTCQQAYEQPRSDFGAAHIQDFFWFEQTADAATRDMPGRVFFLYCRAQGPYGCNSAPHPLAFE